MRPVTMSARSSWALALTIAMKSNSPVTEYTSDTPGIAASASPSVGRAPFSAVMSTTAVITGSPRSQTFDVNVGKCGLHVVRGLLEAHRLAARQRGAVRVVDVGGGLLVVAVERLFELVDRQLDAVACGAADHGSLPALMEPRIAPEGSALLKAVSRSEIRQYAQG